MHQSVFRHQHVETCNSIHQHLETVIPISMGRTLTLWPHGGRPVSLAESLLQLLSLGHSFPPIVFSLLHVAWEILVGCRGTPDFEENHEKKTQQTNTQQQANPDHPCTTRTVGLSSSDPTWSNQCHPVQASPPSNLIRWKNDPALGQRRLFKFFEQVLSGMFQGCNTINCKNN